MQVFPSSKQRNKTYKQKARSECSRSSVRLILVASRSKATTQTAVFQALPSKFVKPTENSGSSSLEISRNIHINFFNNFT